MYIKIDTLGDFLKVIGDTIGEPEASREFEEIFGDTEYLSMTTEEYLQISEFPERFSFNLRLPDLLYEYRPQQNFPKINAGAPRGLSKLYHGTSG